MTSHLLFNVKLYTADIALCTFYFLFFFGKEGGGRYSAHFWVQRTSVSFGLAEG